MGIVVEDGTGLTTSNSYASAADADTYFTDRGITAWTGLQVDKESALIKASAYVDMKFLDRFRGVRQLKYTQAMQWPRTFAVDRNGYPLLAVPAAVKKGTFEAALIFLTTDVTAPLEHGGAIKEESVGPIKTVYTDGASFETTYPAIELALKPVLVGGVAGVRLTR